MISLKDLPAAVRRINRHVANETFNVYYSRGIFGSMNTEQPARIIRARMNHGVMQVKALSTGKWMDVDINLDHFSVR